MSLEMKCSIEMRSNASIKITYFLENAVKLIRIGFFSNIDIILRN